MIYQVSGDGSFGIKTRLGGGKGNNLGSICCPIMPDEWYKKFVFSGRYFFSTQSMKIEAK
jgi:hypothetical protein